MADLSLFELLLLLLGLLLIFEGLLPFFFTERFRTLLHALLEREDRELHVFGGVSILCGCALCSLIFL